LSSPVIGNVIAGIGSGMEQKAASKAEAKMYDKNYDTSGGPLDSGLLNPYQTPDTGTDASTDSFGQIGQWTYDERAGRLVRK
jgi:hypothetical protein